MKLLSLQQKELIDKEIYVYYGVSGAGKSFKVYNDNPIQSVYKYVYSQSGLWFDGYDPTVHKVLLLDEFKGQVPLQVLLQMLDKYPLQVDIKGGRVNFLFNKIYIVSNYHPRDWYINMEIEKQQPLIRRIKDKLTYFDK